MNTCIVGIDPGASGALAFLFAGNRETVSAHDMPLVDGKVCAATLADQLRVMKPDVAFIEYRRITPQAGRCLSLQLWRLVRRNQGRRARARHPAPYRHIRDMEAPFQSQL
jgi:hypothetical protein